MSGNPSRFEIAGLVALVAAAVSGLGLVGWFGAPWPSLISLGLALAGGLAAGLIEGRDMAERLVKAAAFVSGAIAVTLATACYAGARTEMVSVELLIPMGAGLAVFAAARFGLQALESRPQLLRLASLALLLGAPPASWVLLSQPIDRLQGQVEASRPLNLELTADAQGRFFFQGKEVPAEKLEPFICGAGRDPRIRELRVLHPSEIDSRKLAAKILIPAARCNLSTAFVPQKAVLPEE